MRRFLKFFLAITFLWAVTLPWTLNYLSRITPLTLNNKVKTTFPRSLEANLKDDNKVTIGVVACGEKPLNETVVLLKSAILSSIHYGLSSLEAILFADDEHLHVLDIKVGQLKNFTKGLKFRYEIHPVIFPVKNHDEWRTLFKPCASQRLFLHTALPHITEILYLDVDTLIVGDLQKVWSKFKLMSDHQVVGLVPEHEVSSIGWYNRFATHPYYPPLGLNTGVMLLNLTRLRLRFEWETAVLKSYKAFKNEIVFGDQDLINIVFHYKPDGVYLLPCSFNYRPDHCLYGLNCEAIEGLHSPEIQIIHGNRNVFYNSTTSRLFKELYQYFEKFNMTKDDYINDLAVPFKREARKWDQQSNNLSTPNCDNIGQFIFKFVSF